MGIPLVISTNTFAYICAYDTTGLDIFYLSQDIILCAHKYGGTGKAVIRSMQQQQKLSLFKNSGSVLGLGRKWVQNKLSTPFKLPMNS